MSKSVTPSQFLMDILQIGDIDECDRILIVRDHGAKGISFSSNTGRIMDVHALSCLCTAYSQADILSIAIQEKE